MTPTSPLTTPALSGWIPGIPQQQGSKDKSAAGDIYETNHRLGSWRADAIHHLHQLHAEQGLEQPLSGPISLEVTYRLKRARSHYDRSGQVKPSAPWWKETAPDLDKYARAFGDALTQAGTWTDDATNVQFCQRKLYGDTPGTDFALWMLPEPDLTADGAPAGPVAMPTFRDPGQFDWGDPVLSDVLYGTVQQQGSKTRGRNGQMRDANKNLKPWRAQSIEQVQQAMRDRGLRPLLGLLRLEVTYTLSRVRGHYGRDGLVKSSAPWWKTTSPDLDKYARALDDVFTQSGVWLDDSRVVEFTQRKVFGDTPSVGFTLWHQPVDRNTVQVAGIR